MKHRIFLEMAACMAIASLFAATCMAADYRVIIAEYRFFVEKSGKEGLALRVKGKVENTGIKDVRDVVISTDCSGCSKRAANGKWTDASVTLGRKDFLINCLAKGDTKAFELTAATMISPYWASKKGSGTGLTKDFPNAPTGLVVKVASFKPADY